MSNSIPASRTTIPAVDRIEPWTRWWIPEDQWAAAGADQEFLGDHGGPSQSGTPFDDPIPGIAPLEHWQHEPFLLLLGRPGSGKSQEVERAAEGGWLGPSLLITSKEMNASDPAASLDRLVAREAPPAGTRLIIDGLDEALLVNANFTEQLRLWFRDRISDGGSPDLKLAISCRWADWPRPQIEELASLWTTHPVRLVLGPLRRADAAKTLKSRLGDAKADDFWRQMHTHHLVPIACWPQSFLAMIAEFAATGRLARSHSEAMEAELRRRCQLADNRDDRVRWERSVQEAEWRQRVAGRIAALMTFSGRQSFSTDPIGTDTLLSAPEITTRAPESWGQTRRDVTVSDLDSVIAESSLLRRTENGYAFAHQVYQELLTAQWLDAQKTDVRRLAQLFGYEESGEWRSFPGLAAVAASLAAKPEQRPFRKHLLENDPLVLLRLDAVALSDDDRRDLFQALLKRTAEIRTVDPGERHAHWPSLKYNEATADITALLRDPAAHEAAKELALDAARGMELHELAPVLWEVYPAASKLLKKLLARALLELAFKGSEGKWGAVLRGDIPVDADGTLLGAALEIMVPEHMRLGEVVHWIVPERHFDVWGHYQFVVHQMVRHLQPADLPAILTQLAKVGRIPVEGQFVDKLRKASLRLAFAQFDSPGVSEALGNYWFDCLRLHAHPHHDYNEQWEEADLGLTADELRRKIAGFLIKHRRFVEWRDKHYLNSNDFLLRKSDLSWLLTELLSASVEEEWRFALPAMQFLWDDNARADVQSLLRKAWATSAEIRRFLPQPDEGESLEAAILRVRAISAAKLAEEEGSYLIQFEQQKAMRTQRLADYEAACRNWHEKGDLAWSQVFHMLTNRGHYGPGGIIEFQTLEKVASDEDWIRAAARRYLVELPNQKPHPTEDDGMWGVLALGLCLQEFGQGGAIDEAIQRFWLPVFVHARCARGFGGFPDAITNARFAELFPTDFPSAFGSCMARQYVGKSSMEEFKNFLPFWTQEMTHEAVRVLCEPPINAEGFVNAFRHLASASMESAIQVGRHWLARERLPQDAAQKAAVLGACALFAGGRLWTEIKPHFAGDENQTTFRQAAMLGSHCLWSRDKVDFSEWPPVALKEFTEALHRIVPRKERGNRGGFEFKEVTDDDRVEELRDDAYSAATSRGIALSLPLLKNRNYDDQVEESRFASWQQHAAGQNRARHAWHPALPSDLLRLATRPSARLARTADELMAAVVDCLEAYEAGLIRSRWDELWNGTKAKDEKRIARHICDWLKHHLEVPALREPEMPDASRSDIHLCGPTGTKGQPLTVIIEVKKVRRSNAKERAIAMQTQLLKQYLTPNHAAEGWTHGLYLIAWTPEPGSARDSDASLENARQSLRRQADELSTPPFVLRSVVLDARYRGNA